MSTDRRHWNFYRAWKWGCINLYFSTIRPTLGGTLGFDKWSVRLCINLLLVGGFVTLGKWRL